VKKLTGRGVLIWLGGFFAVVIAANSWFVTLSIASFHGEDRVRPFQQGLGYNATLQARARQREEGWRAVIDLTAQVPRRLRVSVMRRDGLPVSGLKLAGTLRHPTDTFRDYPLSLTPTAPGLYEATIPDAQKGWRDVVIRGEGDLPFEAERRLWLP
jgi:nitrogen fixation protein FixH